MLRVALGIVIGACIAAAVFFGRDLIVFSGAGIGVGRASPEAAEAHRILSSLSSRDRQLFCGSLVYGFDEAHLWHRGSQTERTVRFYKHLVETGYFVEDKTPRPVRGTSLVLAPTDKLASLGVKQKGDCYHLESGVLTELKIIGEEKHPTYKGVTVVSATFEVHGVSNYDRLSNEWLGGPRTSSRKVRMLFVSDPFQNNKAIMRRADYGDQVGTFSSNHVPEGLTLINAGGPERLR